MTAAVARATALHAQGHAAVANIRPVDGARLLLSALSALGEPPSDPELRGRVYGRPSRSSGRFATACGPGSCPAVRSPSCGREAAGGTAFVCFGAG